MPLFSIITVTYNAADTIRPTMRSVTEQTFDDYEHIIIDGASTDDTISIVKKYARPALSIYSEKDKGIYDAMNKGIDRASGKYLIFMNSGDTFHSPETLEKIAKESADYPGIIYGQTEIVRGSDRLIVGPRHLTAPRELNVKSFKDGMLICHQSMAVRRDLAPKYDLKYRFSADFDWVVKCSQKSELNIYIDDIIADYLEEGTTTRNHKASLKERYYIMCKHYGTIPTILRHVKFFLRNFIRGLKKH